MTLTITTPPERRTKPGLMPSLINPAWTAGRESAREGWYAEATIDGMALQLSRFDDEPGWTIDAASRVESTFPIWMNGFGARYLLTKTLKPELGRQLDAVLADRYAHGEPTRFDCPGCSVCAPEPVR